MHTNGDEATEAAVEMLERAITAHPRPDHRHTLQHCQMPDLASTGGSKTWGSAATFSPTTFIIGGKRTSPKPWASREPCGWTHAGPLFGSEFPSRFTPMLQ